MKGFFLKIFSKGEEVTSMQPIMASAYVDTRTPEEIQRDIIKQRRAEKRRRTIFLKENKSLIGRMKKGGWMDASIPPIEFEDVLLAKLVFQKDGQPFYKTIGYFQNGEYFDAASGYDTIEPMFWRKIP